MSAILVLLLCFCYGKCRAREDYGDMTIVRENYGVTFHKQGILDNAHSVWHQTFVVSLEEGPLPKSDLYCGNFPSRLPNDTLTTQHFCPTIRSYINQHDRLRKDVHDVEKNIKEMLQHVSQTRSRRALLGFVGRFAKSLFGVSTERDTKILAKQIEQINRNNADNNKDVLAVTQAFQSYIIKADKKFELLNQAVKLTSDATNLAANLWNRAIKDEFSFTRLTNILHIYGAQYTGLLLDVKTHLLHTEQAIQTLLQGYLPYYFVPPQDLRYALDTIGYELSKTGPFKLTHTETGFYYHLQDIVYKLDNYKLFIKVRMPVTTTTTAFTLYRVNSIPIPVAADKEDRTIIDILKPYLAISSDKLFYTLLSESEYQYCTGNHFKRCNQALTMIESSNPNCLTALFYDQPRSVAQFCSVSYLPKSNTSESHVITITENAYLVSSSDTSWIQSCPSKAPLHVTPCKLCIVQLPCACSLKGQSFFIPPTLENCDGLTTPTINHSLNLAALVNFYKTNTDLFNLTAKSFFSKPVFPKIPEVNILTSEFDDVVKREQSVKLSLRRIVKNINAKGKLYSDKTSKLTSELGMMVKPEISSSVIFLTFINLVLVMVALGLSTNVYCKLLVLVRSAHALEFLLTTTQKAQTNEASMTPYHLIPLIILACLVALCIICLRSKKITGKRVPHTKISMTLFGANDYVAIHLSHTGQIAKDLRVETSTALAPKVSISRYLLTITVTWNGLILKTEDDYKLTLPCKINVPISKILKTRKVLQNLNEIQLIACTFGEYIEIHKWLLSTKPQTIQQCHSSSCIYHNPAHDAEDSIGA